MRLRATVAREMHCCMMSHSRLAGHQVAILTRSSTECKLTLVIAALASFDAPAATRLHVTRHPYTHAATASHSSVVQVLRGAWAACADDLASGTKRIVSHGRDGVKALYRQISAISTQPPGIPRISPVLSPSVCRAPSPPTRRLRFYKDTRKTLSTRNTLATRPTLRLA